MASNIVTSDPSFGVSYKNTIGVDDLTVYQLMSNRDSLAIPTDSDGNNPVFTEAVITFEIKQSDTDVTSQYTISESTSTNVTITVSDIAKTATVTAISADVGSFVIKAERTNYPTLTHKINVYKAKAGVDGIDGTDGIGGTIQSAVSLSIIPVDEGSPAGNTRGNNAIDLQTVRSSATNVASGQRSVVSGGSSNSALGTTSVVSGGNGNIAGGIGSVVSGGGANTASANSSTVGGGGANTASGYLSGVFSGYSNTASGEGSIVIGASGNTAAGDYASVLSGKDNTSNSYGEVVLGTYASSVSGTGTSIVSTDPVLRVGIGTGTGSRADAFRIIKDGGIFMLNLKSGATQVGAGAAVDELWVTSSHATLPDGVIMIGL